jgi:hypothetical protein
MEYDPERAKGILDKSFASVKVPIHRDSSAPSMLQKCQDAVWGKSHEYIYFIADGSGSSICTSSTFNIELADGSKQELPWTLSNYMKVSNIKYPSRLRLYCVRKLSSKFATSSFPCDKVVTLLGSETLVDSTSGSDSEQQASL